MGDVPRIPGARPTAATGQVQQSRDPQAPDEQTTPLAEAGQTRAAHLEARSAAGTPGAFAASLSMRGGQASFLGNPKSIDAAEFTAVTGVEVDDAEAAALDAQVKATAKDIGLDHPVGFAREASFMGYYDFAFVGTFKSWDRDDPQILVGVGVKATKPEHIAAFGDVLPSFDRVADDFLSLSEQEKIEVILVHEKVEHDAMRAGSADPHRRAVADAPRTGLAISSRARAHLELYARVDRAAYGAPPP